MDKKERLVQEKQELNKIRECLVAQHAGKYVLFSEGQVQGIYDSHEQGYDAALKKYGTDGVFILHHLVEHEPKVSLSWQLGLLHVQR